MPVVVVGVSGAVIVPSTLRMLDGKRREMGWVELECAAQPREKLLAPIYFLEVRYTYVPYIRVYVLYIILSHFIRRVSLADFLLAEHRARRVNLLQDGIS